MAIIIENHSEKDAERMEDDRKLSKATSDYLQESGKTIQIDGGTEVTELGTTIHNPEDFSGSVHDGEVLSTLRTKSGQPINDMSKVDPERSIVDYKGQTMTLSLAVRMGIVGRDAQGNYVDPTAGAAKPAATHKSDGENKPQQQEAQKEQQQPEPVSLLSPTAASLMDDLSEAIGEKGRVELIARVTERFAIDDPDDVWENVTNITAKMLNCKRESASKIAEAMFGEISGQVQAAITKLYGGKVDADAVWSHYESLPIETQTQLARRFALNDVSAVKHLVEYHYKLGNRR